jgi:hypothetical protein
MTIRSRLSDVADASRHEYRFGSSDLNVRACLALARPPTSLVGTSGETRSNHPRSRMCTEGQSCRTLLCEALHEIEEGIC